MPSWWWIAVWPAYCATTRRAPAPTSTRIPAIRTPSLSHFLRKFSCYSYIILLKKQFENTCCLLFASLKETRCTVIRFVWVSAKFGTCTVVTENGTLVEAKMCSFTLVSTHISSTGILFTLFSLHLFYQCHKLNCSLRPEYIKCMPNQFHDTVRLNNFLDHAGVWTTTISITRIKPE